MPAPPNPPPTPADPARTREARQAYYDRIAGAHLTPLWEVLHALVPPAPRTDAVAASWRYAELRDSVLEAGRLISAEEAERRVLILENPGLRGQSCITNSLYAGLQLILPGEVAPAHRHTQSALRLVLDGEGAYTAVDGERATMRRGDFIVTPAWTWHDHGHLGDGPVVWLDGLDIPIVRFLAAGFAEKSAQAAQGEARPEGDALTRYGLGLVPASHRPAPAEPAKLFCYPFERTRAALDAAARGTPDPHEGFRLRYVNPATGAPPMPTLEAFAQRLPRGFASRPLRCTDGTVFVCLQGELRAEVEGDGASTRHDLAANDILVVPSWHSLRWHSRAESVLFSFSDRPVQRALGLWREERL